LPGLLLPRSFLWLRGSGNHVGCENHSYDNEH